MPEDDTAAEAERAAAIDELFAYIGDSEPGAAVLIERVSGQPFGEFMRERIFDAVGMESTFSLPDAAAISKGRLVRLRPVQSIGHGHGGARVLDRRTVRVTA